MVTVLMVTVVSTNPQASWGYSTFSPAVHGGPYGYYQNPHFIPAYPYNPYPIANDHADKYSFYKPIDTNQEVFSDNNNSMHK